MTIHPAAKAWTDPADLRSELDDLDTLTRDVFGPDVPLRDRVAVLVADWQDNNAIFAATSRQDARRNIA